MNEKIKDGVHTEWYENGQKKEEGIYKNGEKDGLWIEWYYSGRKRREMTFKDGKVDGSDITWYEDEWRKIHTIQSSDKKEFDKQVNELLELGCELMDGGYEVIKNDDGIVYSQVIVSENCELKFFNDGQLEYFSQLNEDGNDNGLYTSWNENGQKREESTWKDGNFISAKVWNEDGSLKE